MKRRNANPAAILAAAFIIFGLWNRALFAEEPPAVPREFRAAWVAKVSNIDWPSRPGLPTDRQQRFREVRYVQLGPRADATAIEEAYYVARGAPQLLVAIVVRPAAWYAFGLLPEQKDFIEQITQERIVVLASLGVPHALRDFPNAAVSICTYRDVPTSQQALVEFLLRA